MRHITFHLEWWRIYQQTRTLIYKNFLVFSKSPISTAIRAFIFPIAITLIFCFLKHISEGAIYDAHSGYTTTSKPIENLEQAIAATSSQRLAFITNGVYDTNLNSTIQAIINQAGLKDGDAVVLDDPNRLFDVCQQSIQGTSDCFAAVIFVSFNQTDAEYIIALDEDVYRNSPYNYETYTSLLSDRILPLQWTIDSQIGNFTDFPLPETQPFYGYFGPFSGGPPQQIANFWLSLIPQFVAPLFILILIGVVYHLSVSVTTERQNSMAELMSAQMITMTPRILSTLLSFLALYLPSWITCSVLLTQILFQMTSDILLILLTVLAGISLTVSAHMVSSFFSRASVAGLFTSILAVALALVTLASMLAAEPNSNQVLLLALIFPPITWSTLIADIASYEYFKRGYSLSAAPITSSMFKGYLYIVFFLVQIIGYSFAIFLVERSCWGVTRRVKHIGRESDIAIRCVNLTKTYIPKTRWFLPWQKSTQPLIAVDKLSFTVKKGSVTFLLGPNGGGKTTTLKCLTSMTAPDRSSLIELNEDGDIFGICPQTNIFWENLTVQEHIEIWRKLKTATSHIIESDDMDIIEECDLMEKRHARAKTLSGGQMRKLQLAISFVGGSKVCCIDEATSGLDPLSRRNIWNIIQKSHSKRTILVTSHFLDEADVLADNIAIIHKGQLVCEGSSTELKSLYGSNYLISKNGDIDEDAITWRTKTSAEATKRVLELEEATDDETYDVAFPTLEQVFLRVTSDPNVAIREQMGDGIVGDEVPNADIAEKILALEQASPRDLELDVGRSIGFARQVFVLLQKRYILLQQTNTWISYGINLLIPIIIAAALSKFIHKWQPLQSCATNLDILTHTLESDHLQSGPLDYPVLAPLESWARPLVFGLNPAAVIAPSSTFSGAAQDEIYTYCIDFVPLPQTLPNSSFVAEQVIKARKLVTDLNEVQSTVIASGGEIGFGLYAPESGPAVLYHDASPYSSGVGMEAMSLLSSHLMNSFSTNTARRVKTSLRILRHVEPIHDIRNLPIAILLLLGFVAATSIATIYPAYEKLNHVRELHYGNGVSPFALWFAYLIFDTQFIIIEGIVVWVLLFSGSAAYVWFAPSYLLGVFILFGTASYLGAYLVSVWIRKAAFAIAIGVHVFMSLIYLAALVMNQNLGPPARRQLVYNYIQYGLGLSVPGANLARALFIAQNTFDVLCGKYGTADVSNPFSYDLYGGVYANLLIQILFLVLVLAFYEYGNIDWFRQKIWQRRVPRRLHYIVDEGAASNRQSISLTDLDTTEHSSRVPILRVSHVSKYYGGVFAAENVTFSIAANETLALLGSNGAGKTTVINIIRGTIAPDFGNIELNGRSIQRQALKAGVHMGICPQDDAVDNLTLRQTLNFYAAVKGLKNVTGNVNKVIEAMNIGYYHNVLVKKLSGGTKRKLSVAIALLGNPKILLLDEPSTGQDAGAKRILWKNLENISHGRAILLTTHSMEEAERLATNVAILQTRMLALGRLQTLQEEFGGVFTVRAVKEAGVSAESLKETIGNRFEALGLAVIDYREVGGQITFSLPHQKRLLGRIMYTMERLKGTRVQDDADQGTSAGGVTGSSANNEPNIIVDYTIRGPTLEEVFANVLNRSGSGRNVDV